MRVRALLVPLPDGINGPQSEEAAGLRRGGTPGMSEHLGEQEGPDKPGGGGGHGLVHSAGGRCRAAEGGGPGEGRGRWEQRGRAGRAHGPLARGSRISACGRAEAGPRGGQAGSGKSR